MDGLIGESAKLTIKDQISQKNLFYTAKKITAISQTHIFFVDKFGNHLGFRLNDILQFEIIN